jgi:sugar/nucleoside kinase (ribokinase family)
VSGHVVVVGDVMTDIIVVPEGPLVRGSDRRAAIRSRPGGSGANQAVWLGALGAPVRFAARVGIEDKSALEEHFRHFGVDPVLAADPTLPSGVLVTIVDPDGERSFLTDRGANLALSPDDLPPTLLDGARYAVCSGYSFFADRPRESVRGFLAEARRRGVATVIDPASVGFLREVGIEPFLAWTEGADILLANAEEAEALSTSTSLDDQMRVLGRRFARVVVKRGAAGAVVGDRNGISFALPAPVVPIRDTSGAGDAFAAGFLAAELLGSDPETCLAAGIAAGARAVQIVGAQPEDHAR